MESDTMEPDEADESPADTTGDLAPANPDDTDS